MANVQVDTSSNIKAGSRVVVRTSGDRVYVVSTSGTRLQIHKGNQNGEPTSFSEVGNNVLTDALDVGLAVCIDGNDDLHIIRYLLFSGMGTPKEIRYYRFDTATDTFDVTNEKVADLSDGDNDGSFKKLLAISVDANNDPHASWNDEIADMGSKLEIIFYANRIGGSWSARVEVQRASASNRTIQGLDIMVADPASSVNADRPLIIVANVTIFNIDAFHGTALNATAFTKASDITGTIEALSFGKISFAIDSNEKITIAFSEETSEDLMIIEHLNSNAWGTWETPVDVDTTTNYLSPSIAIDGTDRFIFVEDRTNNDINLWKATNGTWTEETADTDLPNVGTFNNVKVKWASKNNNSPTKLDYVFEDSGGAVQYNTIDVSAGGITEINVSDTVSVSETQFIGKDFTIIDTTSHTETPFVGKDIVRTITISNGETLLVDKNFVIGESFVGAESFKLQKTLFQLDTLSAVESFILGKTNFILDTISNAENLIVGKTLAIADSISMAISNLVGKTLTITITISLTEFLDIVKNIKITDTISHAESFILTKTNFVLESMSNSIQTIMGKILTIPDTISNIESIIVGKTLTITDSITHVESIIIGKTLTIADSISHAISILVGKTLTIPDTISNIESVILTKTNFIIESISHTENLILTKTLKVLESISHAEQIIVGKVLTIPITISLVESIIIEKSITITETISITISNLVGKNLKISDTISNVESFILTKTLKVLESITHTENIIRNQILTIPDTITHTETLIVSKAQKIIESISDVESIIVTKSIKIIDTITHAESIIREKIITITDSFTNVESLIIVKILKLLDSLSTQKTTVLPDSDISNAGGWTDAEFGDDDGILFDELDEAVPDDFTTAVSLIQNPVPADTFEVSLQNQTDPGIPGNHKIVIRAKGNGTTKFHALLLEGAVTRATTPDFILTEQFKTFTHTITNAEADSITDYNNLRVRIIPDVI